MHAMLLYAGSGCKSKSLIAKITSELLTWAQLNASTNSLGDITE